MYAIIETGGKQYRVQNGDKIAVEKLGVADGETVVFDKVLVVGEGAEAKVGTPYVEGSTVEGRVIETGKGKKVVIFKYKAKKDYRKKQGHRQPIPCGNNSYRRQCRLLLKKAEPRRRRGKGS